MTLAKQLQIALGAMLIGVDGDCIPSVELDHDLRLKLVWTFTCANGNPAKVVRNFPMVDGDLGLHIVTGIEQVQKLMGDA